MSRIGIHIRLNGSLLEAAHKAQRLGCRFFQCFFLLQATNRLIKLTKKEIATFLDFRHKTFDNLYLHGSYWINLASLRHNGIRSFKRELLLAKQLEFTHMIVHSGTAKGASEHIQGIYALAKVLNDVLKTEHEIKFVLENTAHGNLSVGSDVRDFKLLLEHLDYPEKISFCIDTSHAFAFGYDIVSEKGQEAFIDLLDEVIGLERIVMIHLNDTREKRGSRIDRHEIPGRGKIGEKSLKRFIKHPKLKHVPVMIEAPIMKEKDEQNLIETVRTWT